MDFLLKKKNYMNVVVKSNQMTKMIDDLLFRLGIS